MSLQDVRPPTNTEELYHAVGRIEGRLEELTRLHDRVGTLERNTAWGAGFFAAVLAWLGYHVGLPKL